MGMTTAAIPGTIISLSAPAVVMSTQRAYSALAVPSINPLISLNCLLTSSTTLKAALPHSHHGRSSEEVWNDGSDEDPSNDFVTSSTHDIDC